MKPLAKNRILSFVLAFVMLYTALPFRNLIVRAADWEPENVIGSVGTIVKSPLSLMHQPGDEAATNVLENVDKATLPEQVMISDMYLEVDDDGDYDEDDLWYYVDAAPGFEWPQDYIAYHWIEADAVKVTDKNGTSVIVDEDGKKVTEITISKFDKITLSDETSLSISIPSTLSRARTKATGAYQWQICYNAEKNLWVDIYGETHEDITITYGMIAVLLDSTSTVKLRCKASDGEKTNVSDEILVHLAPEAAATSNISGGLNRPNVGTLVLSRTAGAAPRAEETGEVKQTFNIVINYVFENGTMAAQSYTATLAEGVPFPATLITFPTTPGYLPHVDLKDGKGEQQLGSMTLSYPEGIHANITYTVTYRPTDVDYTVKHYFQHVGDDGYSLEKTEIKQGKTGSVTVVEAQDREGFYSLLFETAEIAADGSTEIEIYYDRYYFLMDFELGGGYGTEPKYARYGTTIGTVSDPIRAGYGFEGWATTEGGTTPVDRLPTTMPAHNSTYFAIWKAVDIAKVTIVFWGENADDEKYSYLAKDEDGNDLTKEIYLKPGKTFTYSEGQMLVCDREEHTHNDACTFKCGQVEGHHHSTACYNGVGAETTQPSGNPPSSPQNGYVYAQYNNGSKYIYIDGSWYNYTGSTASASFAPIACGKAESDSTHVHTADCTNCGNIAHTHSEVGGSCYTFTCTIETGHTHSTDCYDGVGNATLSGSIGKPDNPNEGQVFKGLLDTYIYIKGTWYDYSGSTASGSVSPTNCGKTEHTHTNACYTLTCTTAEHTHVTACYGCGKDAHTHGTGCYMNGTTLNKDKWKFVRSDTVTVAADGSTIVNVYYDRTEFTLTFRYNYSRNNYRSSGTITDKWGANIGTRFTQMSTDAGNNKWSRNSSGNYPWTAYLQIMPSEDRTYYMNSKSGTAQTATYYVEKLDSTDSNNANNYEVKTSIVTVNDSQLGITDEDAFAIDGFTFVFGYEGSSTSRRFTQNANGVLMGPNNTQLEDSGISDRLYNGSKFYYKRNSYTLTFNDGYNDVKKESVKYQASLGTYKDYVPDVPSQYEPGSVEFGGWYQNPQCTGEEYKLDAHTMPSSDLILYAKWTPVIREVKFYLTEQSTSIYYPTDAAHDAMFNVPHGDNIAAEYVEANLTKEAMNEAKPNGDYTFVMWYYLENGEKHPFDPATAIRKDLVLYGEWTSNTLKPYTIIYKLKDSNTEIADRTYGSGLAGKTKTFSAKGASDLYPAYREGYFPTVQSQSLLLDIEEENLVIIFEYVPADQVPYTVKYINTETGTNVFDGVTIPDKVVSDNRKPVVTETFRVIQGYMPDAYQKQLVVTVDGENILYFYYTKDETHAYYKITHYIQNADGTTYSEFASSSAVGDIGTRYNGLPVTIAGYTYDHIEYLSGGNTVTDVTADGAVLTANGLEINLYYVRNSYPYKVLYLEQGSGKQLHAPKYGSGLYGAAITESAIDIAEYDKVAPTTVSINIRIETGTEAQLNVITFYYAEKTVQIDYVAVGPAGATGFGSVDPTTETMKIFTGLANGSVPTAGANFRFVGWYLDEACTQPVDASWVMSTNQIKPKKTSTEKNDDGSSKYYVAATYYAKFEYNLVNLTIQKQGADETTDPNQTFLFNVSGEGINLNVTVHGNGSVTIADLPLGNYTVTETEWSWRYEVSGWAFGMQSGTGASASITLNQANNTITFTNRRDNTHWLDGNTFCQNVFAK